MARRYYLRLTPDEWMIPLFGEPEGGKREILEHPRQDRTREIHDGK
jgi:hypothetical protein